MALGRDYGPTDWIQLSQNRIDEFARTTLDRQWIHVDVEKAERGPFGATIAHGFLTLSLVPHFLSRLRRIEGVSMGINYGLDRVRFPAPAREDSRVRASMVIMTVERKSDGSVHIVTRVTIDLENSEKPCCVADLVSRLYF
ncbi:dehydratase [Rhodococcus sp. 14-2470-1a]|nr:dehydratase [Rhodococcus sp. 14-2470-1a]